MEKLINSGLPLELDTQTNRITLSRRLIYENVTRKQAGQMRGLFADSSNIKEDTEIYDVYRGISYPEHAELLKKHGCRYDITVIMPGLVNGEYKKTSGHYHGYHPSGKNTYGEVYEVIKGTALYILQKTPDFYISPANITLEDVILATVHEGQSIIIPPNYGHASVNIGGGPLVFSNLAYISCPVLYDSVRSCHGMSCYIMQEEELIKTVFNRAYKNVKLTDVKNAVVKENPHLGITFGTPVYKSFIDNPHRFDFLGNPDIYVEEIMDMLQCCTNTVYSKINATLY